MFHNTNTQNKDSSLWKYFTRSQQDGLKRIKGFVESILERPFPEKFSFIQFLAEIEKILSKVNTSKQLDEDNKRKNDDWQKLMADYSELRDKIHHLQESNKKSLEKIETYDLIDKFFKNTTIDLQYGVEALVIWLDPDDRVSVSRYKVEKEKSVEQNMGLQFGCYSIPTYRDNFKINPNKLTPLETKTAHEFRINKALKALIEKE